MLSSEAARGFLTEVVAKLSSKVDLNLNTELLSEVEGLCSSSDFCQLVKYIDKKTRVILALYVALRRRGICINFRCLGSYISIPAPRFLELARKLGVRRCELKDYVLYASRKLRLPPSIASNALWLALKAKNTGRYGGLSSSVLAASALYLACSSMGFTIKPRSIARALCVSEASLKIAARMLKKSFSEEALRYYVVETSPHYASEQLEGLPGFQVVLALKSSDGRILSLALVQDSRAEPWRTLAVQHGIPVENSAVLVSIINADAASDYTAVTLERIISYLALKGFKYLWALEGSLSKSVLKEKFKQVSYSPKYKSFIYAIELSR